MFDFTNLKIALDMYSRLIEHNIVFFYYDGRYILTNAPETKIIHKFHSIEELYAAILLDIRVAAKDVSDIEVIDDMIKEHQKVFGEF